MTKRVVAQLWEVHSQSRTTWVRLCGTVPCILWRQGRHTCRMSADDIVLALPVQMTLPSRTRSATTTSSHDWNVAEIAGVVWADAEELG